MKPQLMKVENGYHVFKNGEPVFVVERCPKDQPESPYKNVILLSPVKAVSMRDILEELMK